MTGTETKLQEVILRSQKYREWGSDTAKGRKPIKGAQAGTP